MGPHTPCLYTVLGCLLNYHHPCVRAPQALGAQPLTSLPFVCTSPPPCSAAILMLWNIPAAFIAGTLFTTFISWIRFPQKVSNGGLVPDKVAYAPHFTGELCLHVAGACCSFCAHPVSCGSEMQYPRIGAPPFRGDMQSLRGLPCAPNNPMPACTLAVSPVNLICAALVLQRRRAR